jgi:hypothetical protein
MSNFDPINDWGFTAVTEDELEAVQSAQTTVAQTTASASDLQDRLEKLYNAIIPLLDNLAKNPEKGYIKWENRLPKINAFREHIKQIAGK